MTHHSIHRDGVTPQARPVPVSDPKGLHFPHPLERACTP